MLGNHSKKKEKKRKSIAPTRNYKLSRVLTTSRGGYLASKLIERVMNKGGKSVVLRWCESITR